MLNQNNAFEIEIEIQIVDHCNQNCDNCNHFSNLANPNFMSEEEFIFIIQKIKQEFLPHGLQRIMLVGGEPLLHPQIALFSQILSENFTNISLEILTNGILVNEKQKNINSHVKLIITPYPNVQIKNFHLNSRLFFNTSFIDETGLSEGKYHSCEKYRLPCLFIRNYKLYICPLSGCIDIYNKAFNQNISLKENIDYLSMIDINYKKLQNFIKKGPQCCKYCNQKEYPIYWSKNKYKNYENYKFKSHKELFLTDYEKYNSYFNGTDILKYFANHKIANSESLYLDNIDKNYSYSMQQSEINRIKGLIDIIIPFYHISKSQIDLLYQMLSQQKDIEKYHIYFISDNSPQEEIVFDRFYQSGLNVTFLKNLSRLGPGSSRQLGIDNSFNPYIFFLDCDDLIIKNNYLSQLYNIIQSEDYDIAQGELQIYNYFDSFGYIKDLKFQWTPNIQSFFNHNHGSLYKRDFLIKNNISFTDFFLSEDMDWNFQIENSNAKIKFLNEKGYVYIRSQPYSLGVESSRIDKILYKCLVLMKFNKKDLIKNYEVFSPEEEQIKNILYKYYFLKMNSERKNLEIIKNYINNSCYKENLLKYYKEIFND